MNPRKVLLILAAVGMTPALAASSSDDVAIVQEAKAFLERLIELARTSSLELLDLYADNATIHAEAADAHPDAQLINIQGSHWKKLLRDAIRQGTSHLEVSNFHQATVETRGDLTAGLGFTR
jgi:hypothetical protein